MSDMTKNEFKQGDKVYMAYEPTRSAVVTDVCDEGKYDYYVKEDGSDFTQGCYEGELLDAKTAFLTELQALLRKYDARIYDGDLYAIHIEIGYHSAKSEQADYLFYQSDNDEINADNIMDFNKE